MGLEAHFQSDLRPRLGFATERVVVPHFVDESYGPVHVCLFVCLSVCLFVSVCVCACVRVCVTALC